MKFITIIQICLISTGYFIKTDLSVNFHMRFNDIWGNMGKYSFERKQSELKLNFERIF